MDRMDGMRWIPGHKGRDMNSFDRSLSFLKCVGLSLSLSLLRRVRRPSVGLVLVCFVWWRKGWLSLGCLLVGTQDITS